MGEQDREVRSMSMVGWLAEEESWVMKDNNNNNYVS